jgi:hypothetical protein
MNEYYYVMKTLKAFGDVAQLVERLSRSQKVSGSNPLISILRPRYARCAGLSTIALATVEWQAIRRLNIRKR